MKTESVKEMSMLFQIGADMGLDTMTMTGLAILGAIFGATVFATYAQRWF